MRFAIVLPVVFAACGPAKVPGARERPSPHVASTSSSASAAPSAAPATTPFTAAVCYVQGDLVSVSRCYLLKDCALAYSYDGHAKTCELDDCENLRRLFENAAGEAGLPLKRALDTGAAHDVSIHIRGEKQYVLLPLRPAARTLYAKLKALCPKGPAPP